MLNSRVIILLAPGAAAAMSGLCSGIVDVVLRYGGSGFRTE
jgi:hypothetical protein